MQKGPEVFSSHPFVGTWVVEDEDSDATFVVTVEDGQFVVVGTCISDGEIFEVKDVSWGNDWLSFHARMISTDFRSKNVFRLRDDGKANLELTIYEVWKKK